MPQAFDYRALAWLPGAHLQTLWPALIAPRPAIGYRRERWDAPDGDFIDVDFVDPAHAAGAPAAGGDRRPWLVLFHGLEGSSDSHYALAMMAQARRRGWHAAVPHFRGCSHEVNRLPRAYHSGDSEEIDWILRRFKASCAPDVPLYAAGVSLGGNALLKWLGERGTQACATLAAAVAISPPQDLQAGAQALAGGFNRRVYMESFLKTLKSKSLAKLNRYPGLFDREAMLSARNFFEFDDVVTAPLHGFANCYDYWSSSSSRQFLSHIDVPTLVINARNDPFLPPGALADPRSVSAAVRLEYPDQGGHAGFLAGPFPGRLDWLPQRAMHFFEHG